MKEVVLDTETTGISVKEGHRIVEIGCIELENLIPTKNKFHCYLNPGRKVSEKALEVHGYTDEFLSKQKKFEEIGEEFLSFIKDKRIIIHNAEFDLGHLNNELSILYLLQRASRLTGEPGNLSRARVNVSTISLSIFFFPNIDSSLLR